MYQISMLESRRIWNQAQILNTNPARSGTGFGVTLALLAAVAIGIVLSVTLSVENSATLQFLA